jgi:hypothetical protein
MIRNVKHGNYFLTATAFTFGKKQKKDQKGYREITLAQEQL